MRLEILYIPTADLEASLAFYRGIGWTDLWREGESTAALVAPDGGLQIMLDVDPDAPMGPMLTVDSVRAWHEGRQEGIEVLAEPAEIPGGYLATYREPGGSVLYVIDQSTDATAS